MRNRFAASSPPILTPMGVYICVHFGMACFDGHFVRTCRDRESEFLLPLKANWPKALAVWLVIIMLPLFFANIMPDRIAPVFFKDRLL
jgi:hypothetical protein